MIYFNNGITDVIFFTSIHWASPKTVWSPLGRPAPLFPKTSSLYSSMFYTYIPYVAKGTGQTRFQKCLWQKRFVRILEVTGSFLPFSVTFWFSFHPIADMGMAGFLRIRLARVVEVSWALADSSKVVTTLTGGTICRRVTGKPGWDWWAWLVAGD